jgi:hypothetical protein
MSPPTRFGSLYHLADTENLTSILRHGLMSTERLLLLADVAAPERAALLRCHRRMNLQLRDGLVIRDQRPMPPAALAPALKDGLTPSDWYALLNSFVFLWPDRQRMQRQRSACRDRPQTVLTFDGRAPLDRFAAKTFVSPINSANARRKPAERGRETLLPYTTWLKGGWPTGRRSRAPAEFLFRCVIPAQSPYLIDVSSP